MMTLECKMIIPISINTFQRVTKDNHKLGRKIKHQIDLKVLNNNNLFTIYMIEQVIQVQWNRLSLLAPTTKLQIKAEAWQANKLDKTNTMTANI
jgi:hypothetical protein